MDVVEKLFWEDPYKTEVTARVTSVDGAQVTVDRTIAYAAAGGQESDGGTINSHPIRRAEKAGRQIIYCLDEGHDLRLGDEVTIRIDWERRYKIMRLHFAAEIILELVTQHYGSPEKIGAHIAADKARVDFVWQGNIAQTFDFLEGEANRMIDRDLPIKSDFSDAENEIRYWEITHFARVPCGGTHIRSTGEIGGIALKRNNIGKGKERIEITLAKQTDI
ncbi:MAG: alanyl-tRNA editing protein [Negativicutes bacterium]|nr:alanyl-tRNA editing protein [Negativicutes bacterium]